MAAFQLENIPSQKNKIAIVTGANAGLGYETTLGLAKKEMTVVMACRNLEKAKSAKEKILKEVPSATLEIIQIDLSKLKSVRKFSTDFLSKYKRLDLLINNAGVMMPPYEKTEDGFELQLAANHFGHFLLTSLLLPALLNTPNARIVSISSIAHKNATINFKDLQSENEYSKFGAYGQSKLACLLFSKELQRRLENAGHTETLSVAAHPGASNTELARHLPTWLAITLKPFLFFVTHSPKNAARATLMAALDTDIEGGAYIGPQGIGEMKGDPGHAKVAPQANDSKIATRLWRVSEKLTGAQFNF